MRFFQPFLLALTFLLVWNLPVLSAEKNNAVLESISFPSSDSEGEKVNFKLSKDHTPGIFIIQGENPRLVLDFPDTQCADTVKRIHDINGRLAKRIRIGIHNDQTLKTRVVVDLTPNGKYQYTRHFNKQDNTLLVTIFKAKADFNRKEEVKKKQIGKPVKGPQEKKTLPLVEKEIGSGLSAPDKEAVKTPEKDMPPTPEPENTSASSPLLSEKPAVGITLSPEPKSEAPEIPGGKKTAVEKEHRNASKKEAPSAKSTGKKPEPLLSGVSFEQSSAKGEMIVFKLNGFFPPTVFGIEKDAPRVICDFPGAELGGQVKETIHCHGKYVESVQIVKQKKQHNLRAILHLVPNRNYDLQQVFFKEDNLFVIYVNSQDALPEGKTTISH